MIMTHHTEILEKMIEQSTESSLLSVNSNGQVLTLLLRHEQFAGIVEFKIDTTYYFSNFSGQEFTPCYLALNEITEDLSVQHGIYVAANGFVDFMHECRHGFHIAYGLRASQYHYFFKILGGCKVIIPIQTLNDIQFRYIN